MALVLKKSTELLCWKVFVYNRKKSFFETEVCCVNLSA